MKGTTSTSSIANCGFARRAGSVLPIDRLIKGNGMPTIAAFHNVKDKAHWLASPKRKELFGPLGITNIRTFVDPQNQARVAVLMDVPDMGALMSAMKSKAAADAMAYDGVLPETLVILVES
jgi:hypothetical protein